MFCESSVFYIYVHIIHTRNIHHGTYNVYLYVSSYVNTYKEYMNTYKIHANTYWSDVFRVVRVCTCNTYKIRTLLRK